MSKENYVMEYYTVKSCPSFSEYSLQYNVKNTFAYYGPPFASQEDATQILRSLFAEYLGEPVVKYIDGYYGSRGGIVSSVVVIEGRKANSADYIVKMVEDELIISKTNSLEIEEIEREIMERNQAERTKRLIELYEDLSVEERVEVVKKMLGGIEND